MIDTNSIQDFDEDLLVELVLTKLEFKVNAFSSLDRLAAKSL